MLAAWSGLGYYRRARALHRAAALIVAERGGRLPATHAGWLSLPGVGPYTAGAIASIGLREVVPAVDANARRVLSRWLYASAAEAAVATAAEVEGLAAEVVDPAAPGDWNQAVMELGATLCQARRARCAECPVLDHCRAGAAGRALEVPLIRTRPAAVPVWHSCLVWCAGDAVLLMPPGSDPVLGPRGLGRPLRRDFTTLHPGLWGLPGSAWYHRNRQVESVGAGRGVAASGGQVERAFRHAWQLWSTTAVTTATGATANSAIVIRGPVRHAITEHRLAILVAVLTGEPALTASVAPAGSRWFPAHRLTDFPISRLAHKCLTIALGE